MSDETNKKVQLNWPSLFLLAAVAGNLLWIQSPLKSSRPSEKEGLNTIPGGAQDVQARLWQDPFEAVLAYRKKTGLLAEGTNAPILESHGPARLLGQVWARLKDRTNSMTILPVMVTGSPYVEGHESRLRSRYAVLSALQVAGYVPEDGEHVGYTRVAWPNVVTTNLEALVDGPSTNCETMPLSIPYEWFRPNSLAGPSAGASDHVLVVWLKDELFADHPPARLAQVLASIRDKCILTNFSIPRSELMPVKIIGPWSSTTLEAMVEENDTGLSSTCTNEDTNLPSTEDSISNALANVEVYSASATAADALLLHLTGPVNVGAPTNTDAPRTDIALHFKTNGIVFHNVTCTDDQLCGALIRELARRGVDFNNQEDHVVLISEWDTTYGRSLPEVFYRAATNCYEKTNVDHIIKRFVYLRGVDGQLADDGTSAFASSGSTAKSNPQDKRSDFTGLQRPEGRSQLDYIPRLVARLKREAKLESEHHGGEFKAFGILGSDVYDKLLLLQSLHQSFPQAIFFTTDLDARLFHPSQLKWSRNLIVASSFGLDLGEALQTNVPPFRDSYQTAEFLACQAALGICTNEISSALWPRLFEIGQRGAYDLSTGPTNSVIYPNRMDVGRPFPVLAFWKAVLAILLGGLLLYCISPATRPFFRYPCVASLGWLKKFNRMDRNRADEELGRGFCGILVLGALFIVVGYVVLVWIDQNNPGGEPFSFFAGISIWPAELARMFTFCLCIGFFIKAWHDLQTNGDKLKALFGPELVKVKVKPPKEELEPGSGFHHTCRRLWRRLTLPKLRRAIGIDSWKKTFEPGKAAASASQMCLQYEFRGRFFNRCVRLLPNSVIYMFFAVLLMFLFGKPSTPYRGWASRDLDFVALFLSVCAFIILIFFVIDATRLCSRFIRMTKGATDWGEAAAQFGRRRALPAALLDDWLDVYFIGQRTKVVSKLIYYPFIVLFLMIISRNHYFDDWDWPLGLILVLGLNSAFALWCAIHLRREAERARKRALTNLNERLCAELGGETDTKLPANRAKKAQASKTCASTDVAKPNRIEQIRLLIKEVESNEEGAFAPFSRNPIVGAILMPFGGAGILALLDFITTH